ncbi:MAG: hypothetical protein MJY79_07665 [Bacteroidaceae bacterium]|nr:hypothetical protein [Bacteroidaceae bacterium]
MKKAIYYLSFLIVTSFWACKEDNSVELEKISLPTATDINAFGAKLTATINGYSVSDISRGEYGFLLTDKADDAVFLAWAEGQTEGVTVIKGTNVDSSGNITATITSALPNSNIWFCAFMITRDGEHLVGKGASFTTTPFNPSLSLQPVETGIPGFYSCSLNATTSLDETSASQCTYGVVFSKESMSQANSTNSVISGNLKPDGSYTAVISGLDVETMYYCRAYICVKKTNEYYYSNEVTFSTKSPSEMAVDMGLSVMWANCNLGAEDYTMPGDCYKWGVTVPSTNCDLNKYPYYDQATQSYTNIGTCISGTEYDAATARLGGKWRMPTTEEVAELHENVKSYMVDNTYVKLTSTKNGKSIYLKYMVPLFQPNSSSSNGTFDAKFWMGDIADGNSGEIPYWHLGYTYFNCGTKYNSPDNYQTHRESAMIIRPVCDYE